MNSRGSNSTHSTLPSEWYFDPAHFQRELKSIWWDEWLCVARAGELGEPGQFKVIRVGSQQVIITRRSKGELQAFHNTCRHRGSLLCESDSGSFHNGRIVCPYHAWVYSLDGELQNTPRLNESDDFNRKDYSLYPVAVDSWAGFIFINLAETPSCNLKTRLAGEANPLSNWPMPELLIAHRQVHHLDCNWKVFWENFLECYHCPNIHRELCALVPVYGQGVSSPEDLPGDHALLAASSQTLLKPGAVTWSGDGSTSLPWFDGLSREEQSIGMTFFNLWPSVFIVAHVDYVRSVQVMPDGPEKTRLTVDWLVSPETMDREALDIPGLVAFGQQVVLEDARVCELNQKGLHSQRHRSGVLTEKERDVLAFDQWVMARLGD